MNKELEALKFLWEYINPKESWQEYPDLLKTFGVLETALKKLERWESLKITEEQAQWLMILINNPESQLDKLAALKTIKEVMVIEEEDFFYDKEFDMYFFMGYKVSKEQYNLLKKVLLWAKN